MKLRKLLTLLGIFTIFFSAYSQEYTKEELDNLKKSNLISQEDYIILLAEIGESDYKDQRIFELIINGTSTTNSYKTMKVGNKEYFPVFNFLEQIKFTNYIKNSDNIKLLLGDNLKEVYIDMKNKKISVDSKTLKLKFDEVFKEENGEIFLENSLFEQIFLSYLNIYEDRSVIRMNLNFNSPEIIQILMENNSKNLEKSEDENSIVYTNPKKIFELGNTRLQLNKSIFKSYTDKKRKYSWDGSIEYQGSVLYGDLTTTYDLKNEKFGDTYIEYPDIIQGHIFRAGSYNVGNVSREWGVSLKKNKGYYEDDKTFIISDTVPIGSRVELIYLGHVIAIQDANSGEVTFENSEIKGNRKYQLKIYTPDGKILIKEINTAETFNQQNKGETEYNIELREDNNKKSVQQKAEVFYGVTNNLTVGTKYRKEFVDIDSQLKNLDTGELELIYSDYIKKTYPYTFRLGTERTFNNYVTNSDSENQTKYKDRYIDSGLFQIEVNKWKFRTEKKGYGEFYDLKTQKKFKTEYTPFDALTLSYNYERNDYLDGKRDSDTNVGLDYSHSVKNLLMTVGAKTSRQDSQEYNLNLYYSGFSDYTVNLENKWKGRNCDYEAAVKLYNNNLFGILDYSVGVNYSKVQKEKFFFEFTVRYDNLFKISSKVGDQGTKNFTVGIDKVVDLRSITSKIDSLDSSPVKAITFIDENNNNRYDKGEKLVDNVSIKIGNQTELTNEDGEAFFFGVPNSMAIDLKPTIKKPSYTIGDNKIQVKGKGTSTIEAYIPIKPMLTLNGEIIPDDSLNLLEGELDGLYNDIIVKVKTVDGKEIETTMADETGVFSISGLFPEKYKIEVEYIGDRFEIPEFKQTIDLVKSSQDENRDLTLYISKDGMKISNGG